MVAADLVSAGDLDDFWCNPLSSRVGQTRFGSGANKEEAARRRCGPQARRRLVSHGAKCAHISLVVCPQDAGRACFNQIAPRLATMCASRGIRAGLAMLALRGCDARRSGM